MKKIAYYFKKLWIRLTWCHVISFNMNSMEEHFEEDTWYNVNYRFKRDGKYVIIESIVMNPVEDKV